MAAILYRSIAQEERDTDTDKVMLATNTDSKQNVKKINTLKKTMQIF